MAANEHLQGLRMFVAVADSGGFTAAAGRLGVTKASVSLHVQRLEKRLGASLFSRTTRQVRLTDAGANLHRQVAPALAVLEDAVNEAGAGEAELSGTLRLTGPVEHTIDVLAPAVAAFSARHPRLQIELHTNDRMVDLVAAGIDLGIRCGTLRDSSLRAVKLGEFEQCVVASPGYLERRGIPRKPADLADHDWIALTLLRSPLTWDFTPRRGRAVPVRMRARVRTDSSASLRALLENGAGVSIIDHFSVGRALERGSLVRLLPEWSLPRGGVYAVVPPGRHVPQAVRRFIEFYRSALAERARAGP